MGIERAGILGLGTLTSSQATFTTDSGTVEVSAQGFTKVRVIDSVAVDAADTQDRPLIIDETHDGGTVTVPASGNLTVNRGVTGGTSGLTILLTMVGY